MISVLKSNFIFLIFLLAACDPLRIANTDPFLSRRAEYVFYNGQKFSGLIESKTAGIDVLRITPYRDGLIDGEEKDIHINGQVLAEREFEKGKKVGIHKGWFPNGNKRFQNEYLDSQFHGNQWEWRPSGGLYSFAKFDRGRVIGKKLWREDGQIYMNFVLNAGRPIGMTGGKLCNQVRGDGTGNTIQF